MRIAFVVGLAAVGVFIAILGTVLYSVGPEGESGYMAGKGGILFWWLSIPGYVVGTPFLLARVPESGCGVIGGGILWGVIGFVLGSSIPNRSRRRGTQT
jgi:hypothetical protein